MVRRRNALVSVWHWGIALNACGLLGCTVEQDLGARPTSDASAEGGTAAVDGGTAAADGPTGDEMNAGGGGDSGCDPVAVDSGFSGVCLTDASAAPLVQGIEGAGPLPSGMGGTVADGTYFLTTRTTYGISSYDAIVREELRISGQEMLFVVREDGATQDQSGWAIFETSTTTTGGSTLTWEPDWQCPPAPRSPCAASGGFSVMSTEYTATPTQLILIYPATSVTGGSNVTLTFDRQG